KRKKRSTDETRIDIEQLMRQHENRLLLPDLRFEPDPPDHIPPPPIQCYHHNHLNWLYLRTFYLSLLGQFYVLNSSPRKIRELKKFTSQGRSIHYFPDLQEVHLLREKLELCNKDGAHTTVVHL
ncbi:hypothetical protein L9F63_013961, partial [Diploptera punctata]